MKTRQKILVGLLAVLPVVSVLLITGEASAQQYSSAAYNNANPLRIDGFNVDEVTRLAPGTELNFSLYGSPGAVATLMIAGAQRSVAMSESAPGQYEGTYTITSRDTIRAQSQVTANLRLGNQVISMVLNESLQAGVGYRSLKQTNAALPRITRFDVQPSAELSRGNDLAFALYGSPNGKAEISINGAKGKFFLPEVRSGEYAGVYRIKPRDHINASSAVTATLRVGDAVTTSTLGQNLQNSALPLARVAQSCISCGSVEAVNAIETKGEGSYLGTIGGGVVGALLGNQIGNGNGRTAATIAGAIGGAYAGRTVEGSVKKSVHYEVVVRLQNGGSQTVSFQTDPGYKVGDHVKTTAEGGLVRDV